MTCARSEIVVSDEVAIYHCVSRCVRRAFLCGRDTLSHKSFEHRREWIRERLSTLLKLFAIELVAYAVMSNHLHSVVKSRPDTAKEWDAEEVARRWRTLFPLRRVAGKAAKPNEKEIQAIAQSPVLVKLYRERLSSISWFNRCMNEHIARRANAEDDCTGRFWEGRFKCQRVFDIAGILACSAYVDLNPIRAGIAKTLEGSDHTSIQDRLFEQTKDYPARYKNWSKVALLSIAEASENSVTLKEYIKLVEETGRIIVQGKGSISCDVEPILKRLNVAPEQWVETTQHFKKKFHRMVGPVETLRQAAKRVRKRWFHGIRAARKFFRPPVTAAAASTA